jgi:tetratricopeptide (TPR) repeat protein
MANSTYKWLFLWLVLFSSSFFAQEVKPKPEEDTLPKQQKLYNQACKLIDSAKYKDALPLLKKAIKLKPDYWQALNKSAYAKIQLKEYKDAEKVLTKSELILPQNFETLKLKGINFFLNNKFKESKGAIDTAVNIALDDKIEDAELFYYQAQLMYKGKSYKSALGACDNATEINKKYLEVILLKAEIRFTMKDYNYAIKELNEAIKLMKPEKPDYNAYKLRAKSKFEVKDFKGAITDWTVYLDGNPGEEDALVARAANKINVNDNSGAIVDLDEAIKKNNKNPVSYCYRGVAKGGNKNNTEALKDLDYAIKLKFDYGAAYVNRAAIKMASKDKHGACDDLKKADGLGDELALKLSEQYCK